MHPFSLLPKDVTLIETAHRKIVTPIPHPESAATIKRSMEIEPLSMNDQLPIVWHGAKGYQVWDKHGNIWIDFTSTIFVANVGHSHPKICEAIIKTVEKNHLNSYNYTTDLRVELAEKLLTTVPKKLNKVFFISTGSESSEASIKVARLWGEKQSPRKRYIIAFENSFHGKTMGSQTLGGKVAGKKWIKNLHPDILHLPYPYPWVLKEQNISGAEFFQKILINLLDDRNIDPSEIASIMLEPYQGWCAVFFPQDFIEALNHFCKVNNILVAVDEVQAGFGRTGKMWGYECYENLVPDLIWCGKAISASVPVACVIANESILEGEPSLNSTHGGSPIGMASSLAVLNVLSTEDLLNEANRKGKIIETFLKEWHQRSPHIVGNSYGSGMVWATLIKNPNTGLLDAELVDKIIHRAFEKGLLSIRTCSGTIKLGPPLTIPDSALLEGLHILSESLEEII